MKKRIEKRLNKYIEDLEGNHISSERTDKENIVYNKARNNIRLDLKAILNNEYCRCNGSNFTMINRLHTKCNKRKI